MRRLLCYMKGYGRECVLGPFFKLLEASFELIVPLVMASIIDKGVAVGDRGHILKMCGVLFLLAVVGLTASLTAQYFAAKAATGFAAKLRYALFAHIENLSFPELDQMGASTLITRMTSDVNQVQNGVNLVLRLFLRSPFVVFGAMVMAFTVNVRAAMVFVVTIPLLSVVVFGVMIATMPLFRKVQQGLDRVLLRTRENLAGVRVIRAFHKEEEERKRFSDDNDALARMQILVGRISGLTNPLTYIIINASVIAVIWLGAGQVYEGVITQGAVIALVNYMSQILVELVKLANLIVNITKSLACANRIADVLEMQPSICLGENGKAQERQGTSPGGREAMPGSRDASSEKCDAWTGGPDELPGSREAMPGSREAASKKCDAWTGGLDELPGSRIASLVSHEAVSEGVQREAVRFEHVDMQYPGAAESALHGVDLAVERGQTIGIIGGTGSGKSTLVHLIPRFYDVSQGAVYVDGRDVRTYDPKELRAQIGIVMQKTELFAGSIADNLRWGNPSAGEEQLWRAVALAQAQDVVTAKGGLDGVIEEGGKNLSGGQRQRLAIARALVRDPKILIFDDSSSALDFATDARLRKALRSLKDKTVFLVSQRTSSIRHADQILVLDDGEVVGLGTHEELLESCGVYREIEESQR